MAREGIDRAEAERLRRDADRAREAYVRHFYAANARDPALYHVVIDSTRLPLDAVVDLIAAAVTR
jgi:cytidylate kinase